MHDDIFMHLSKFLLSCLLALAPVASLRADFSGDYSVGSAANYSLVSGASTTVGQWSALLTTTGGSGSVNTHSAPGSVTLSATGNGGFGMGIPGNNASLAFTYTFASSGIVSFSYSIGTAGGFFGVTLDSVAQTASGSAYSFNVSSGQTLAINVSATGMMGTSFMMTDPITFMPMFYPMPGASMTETVTISNFSGPSAIPEPSSFALIGGLGALAAGGLRRRRA